MTPDELLREYRRCALRRGAAETPQVANKAHDELLDVVRAFRDNGQGHRILELLDDPSEHVRLRAGFDALWLSPEDGLRVLRELAGKPSGEVPFHASTCLSLLEEGELVLYPWEQDNKESK